ncbi:TnpV protein [Mediterraneibacter sp. HCN-7094]
MTEFEKAGGTYRKEGMYLLPNLTLPEDGQAADIGVWGIRHRRYLKQHHRVLYYNLLTAGKLDSYLVDIDQRAKDLFDETVRILAENENMTEKLKADDSLVWIRKINNIRNQAMEIVNAQLIFN